MRFAGAPALGAGRRQFKSGRPDQFILKDLVLINLIEKNCL
jgi:hypothetical protein